MTAFDQLLEIQAFDTQIDQLAHKRAHLEARQHIAEADQILATLDGQIAAQDKVVSEQRRVQRRIEDELASQEARADAINTKLYGGSVTAARELQDLQSELDGARQHISSIEDEDLGAIEALDEAEAQRAHLSSMREQVLGRREESANLLTAGEAEIDAEVESLRSARNEVAGLVDAAVLDEYERLRGAFQGVAVARLVGNRCEGCHLTLPAMEVDRIHRLDATEPAYCDECGRLLVR